MGVPALLILGGGRETLRIKSDPNFIQMGPQLRGRTCPDSEGKSLKNKRRGGRKLDWAKRRPYQS